MSAEDLMTIPFAAGLLTGTPAQFFRLGLYLRRHAATADPARRARVLIWDGQHLIGTYADLGALAERLVVLEPPARARYTPPAHGQSPAAYRAGSLPFAQPGQVASVTQTLNARGSTGGLRAPGPDEAQPANPAALHLSRTPQSYIAQICGADLQSAWGWTPAGPAYAIQAGHILVAAVLLAVQHHLVLAPDQLLAIRWQRSPAWDCYLPAGLLNDWRALVAPYLAAA